MQNDCELARRQGLDPTNPCVSFFYLSRKNNTQYHNSSNICCTRKQMKIDIDRSPLKEFVPKWAQWSTPLHWSVTKLLLFNFKPLRCGRNLIPTIDIDSPNVSVNGPTLHLFLNHFHIPTMHANVPVTLDVWQLLFSILTQHGCERIKFSVSNKNHIQSIRLFLNGMNIFFSKGQTTKWFASCCGSN